MDQVENKTVMGLPLEDRTIQKTPSQSQFYVLTQNASRFPKSSSKMPILELHFRLESALCAAWRHRLEIRVSVPMPTGSKD
jgi:hypothetical protein